VAVESEVLLGDGKLMKAMLSIVVCSGTWFMMPVTVKQCPPIHT
jgi:hypothetical protein